MEKVELVLVVERVSKPGVLQVGASFKVSQGNVLGRSPECALCLDDRTVSRRHAELACRDGVWWVENLTEGNGVFWQGRAVEPGAAQRLSAHTGQLQLGGVVLRAHLLQGTVPVNEPVDTEPEAFLRLVRDGDRCTVFCKGRFVPMKPSSALALFALAQTPGRVLHAWDMQEAMGLTCNLSQALSGVRRALRALVAEGWVTPSELIALIGQVGGGEQLRDLESLSETALMRRFLMARRGHGYILMAPAQVLVLETEG